MTLLIIAFIVFAVLSLTVAEADVPAVFGVVKSGVPAAVDTDFDVLNAADNLGWTACCPARVSAGKHPPVSVAVLFENYF